VATALTRPAAACDRLIGPLNTPSASMHRMQPVQALALALARVALL